MQGLDPSRAMRVKVRQKLFDIAKQCTWQHHQGEESGLLFQLLKLSHIKLYIAVQMLLGHVKIYLHVQSIQAYGVGTLIVGVFGGF